MSEFLSVSQLTSTLMMITPYFCFRWGKEPTFHAPSFPNPLESPLLVPSCEESGWGVQVRECRGWAAHYLRTSRYRSAFGQISYPNIPIGTQMRSSNRMWSCRQRLTESNPTLPRGEGSSRQFYFSPQSLNPFSTTLCFNHPSPVLLLLLQLPCVAPTSSWCCSCSFQGWW